MTDKELKKAVIAYGELQEAKLNFIASVSGAKDETSAKRGIAEAMKQRSLQVYTCKDRHGSVYSSTYVNEYTRKSFQQKEAIILMNNANIVIPYKEIVIAATIK